MTYGESTIRLREQLTVLLRQHRIQQRLGGKGLWTVPESTTIEERRELGNQIRRYRQALLVWSRQALTTSDPWLGLGTTSSRSRTPAEDLQVRLEKTINASSASLPNLDELGTEQPLPMVEIWRQAARAAVVGEQNFGAGGLSLGSLSEQQMTVLRDVADVTQALVVLDVRYDRVPGWESLEGRGWLDRSARAAAAFASWADQDLATDANGWTPPPALIEGPALPGIGGVVQAEHNMLVHLSRFPDPLSLKRVVDSQRVLSHELASRAHELAPELATSWAAREATYARLQVALRNVGGQVGNGGLAAAEGANAMSRLRRCGPDDVVNVNPLRDMDKLFRHTDARVATLIERGASQRLYFQRVAVPRLIDDAGQLISPVRERYVPIKAGINADLLEIVRQALRPPPPPPPVPPVPPESAASRTSLRQAINHKPDRRPSGPSV